MSRRKYAGMAISVLFTFGMAVIAIIGGNMIKSSNLNPTQSFAEDAVTPTPTPSPEVYN